MRSLLSRLKLLLRGRGQALAEFDDELASHRDLLASQYERRGVEPAAARRMAQARLGRAAELREHHYEALGLPFLDVLMQDLRYATRVLRRDAGFTWGIVLTLGFGIGVTTAVFTLVDTLLLRSLPYRNERQLILMNRLPLVEFADSRARFEEWKRGSTLLSDAALYATSEANIDGGAEPMHANVAQVSANLPSLLGAEPVAGRSFTPDEGVAGGPAVAMIGAPLWRRLFAGNAETIGKQLRINGRPYTIIGVLPSRFDFPAGVEVWTPTVHSVSTLQQFGAVMFSIVARMKSGMTIAQVVAQQKSVFGKQYPSLAQEGARSIAGVRFEQPPVAQDLRTKLSSRSERPVLLLFACVCLILLIACVNVANLVLARTVTREREFAVRRALGVSNARLTRQIVTEQTLVGLLGGVGGIAIAYFSMSPLKLLLPSDWPSFAGVQMGIPVLGFAVAVSLISGWAIALAPVVNLLRRPETGLALNDGSRFSERGRSQRWRHLLVSAEAAIAMTLLACTGVLVQSFIHIAGIDPGFRPASLLVLSVSRPDAHDERTSTAAGFYRAVLDRLRSLPGVESAGAVDFLPASEKMSGVAPVKRDPADRGEGAVMCIVTPDYFRAMQIPLLAGRDFTERDDRRAGAVAIVSQTLAGALWPGQSAVGKSLYVFGARQPATVVGIAGSVRFFGPRSRPMPEVYFPYTRRTPDAFSFVMRARVAPLSLIPAVRQAVRAISAAQPIDGITTMNDYWSRGASHERSLTALAGVFTLLGMTLAVIGVYALISYSVKCRQHEFGIRMALGARAGELLAGAVGRVMLWLVPGLGAGMLMAFALARVLQSELYEVRGWEPGLTAALACALLLITAIAGLAAARRAGVLDPACLLRWE